MFKNRTEAGQLLGKVLQKYKNKNVVIFALPRGGVVLGFEVAKILESPLDIIVTRKVGHPDNPEYAICAVDDKNMLLCEQSETRMIDQNWLKQEIKHQREEAKRRVDLYRGGRKPEVVSGKVAIIVDDGIATGLSMRLAVRAIKRERPKKIIVAVPVASFSSIDALKAEGADEIVVLTSPEEFKSAVGAHYLDFPQISDEEVIRLLLFL